MLRRHWKKLGLALDADDFTDDRAIAAVARITGGNFRLLQRLFNQIGRILTVNEMTTITEDVVEAARSTLVIGAISDAKTLPNSDAGHKYCGNEFTDRLISG